MKNGLKHLSKFSKILGSYKVSDVSKIELGDLLLVLFVAPTSIGRNTIIKELEKTGRYRFVPSDTTRGPRINNGVMEQSGREYFFISEEDMLKGLEKGKYIEASLIHGQQVSGRRAEEFSKVSQEGKIAVFDIEIQGVDAYLQVKPDALCIFVLPPSFEEWLRRLKHRGHMSPAEFRRRLESAGREFDYALTTNKFIYVINDDLNMVVEEVNNLISEAKVDLRNQENCRQLLGELREKVRNYRE